MNQKYSNIIIAVLSAIVTLCAATIAHMNEKARELSEAVLVQNLRISQLEQTAAVNKYRLNKLDARLDVNE
jgi:hypothetical protein